jgi:hypothetical protein
MHAMFFGVGVEVNGRKVEALLDTGAPMSVVSRPEALRAGAAAPGSPRVVAGKPVHGFGKAKAASYVTRFDSFAIGDETVCNVRLTFADLAAATPTEAQTASRIDRKVVGTPDMLLGANFFRAHRIYAAYSQNRLYFTYNGGQVFETADRP